MKNENIDYKWLTKPTGDPYADIGGYVIEYLMKEWNVSLIIKLIERATDIYVKKWDNNLHSFFLNSTITHNSNKGQKGITNTLKYYKGLLADENSVEGYCRITGKKGKVFLAARDNHIMSGSATLINFHHAFESGIMLSKEAIIRMFFVALGVEQLGDKVALLISNKENITKFFVKRNIDNNIRGIASGISSSILKSEFSNPANALFEYAKQCIDNSSSLTYNEETGRYDTENVSLNLFHFTNFGAKPAINIYTLPAPVFSFYAYCLNKHKKEWQDFVFRNYRNSKFKNAVFDETDNSWKDTKDTVGYDTFKVWRNAVFDNLLSGESIRRQILTYIKEHTFNFNIVEKYQIIVRNMDKKTLSKIKELASFIVDDRSEDDIKKMMTRLNGAKRPGDLRTFLLKLEDINYNEENREPLFTLDEYVNYLFPDGAYWAEIRDLLMIGIYERLHETNKKVPTPDPEKALEESTNE